MSVSECEVGGEAAAGGGRGGGGADTELKTKTPHVNVGKNQCQGPEGPQEKHILSTSRAHLSTSRAQFEHQPGTV